MERTQFLASLGLSDTASREEIQRAFRREALRLHPDHQQEDAESRKRFIDLAKAYRATMRAMRGRPRGVTVGLCAGCRDYVDLFRRLDGRLVCERCLSRSTRMRFLPLPDMIIVVKCLPAVVLNLASLLLLILAMTSGSNRLAMAALASGFLAVVSLVVTCLHIRHCVDQRALDLHRRLTEAGRRGTGP